MRARSSLGSPGAPAQDRGRSVVVPVDVLDRLAPHAARRGLHVNALVRLIVVTVAEDAMVDAVLDDREEGPADA